MRTIDGYVCVATRRIPTSFLGKKILYGPKSHQICSDFHNGDVKAYQALSIAERAKRLLEQQDRISSVKIARLEMRIAESTKDLPELKDSKSLVVIVAESAVRKGSDNPMLGPMYNGLLPYKKLPAQLLYNNDFKPFTTYKEAINVLREVNQELHCPGTIASFKLEKVKKQKNK